MAQQILNDGTFDFSLGQDSWHHPDRIQKNQYAKGINVTTKGGTLKPRPRYHRLEMIFDDDVIELDVGTRPIEQLWQGGKFQAALPFTLVPDRYILSVVCGFIFITNVATGHTSLMSKDIRVNPNAARINWSYAGQYIVIFDYPDYPVIIQGEKIFRANPNNIVNGQPQPQVPISVLGTYNQNRLFVANAGVEFTAGDPVGNLQTPEAPITFTEVFGPNAPFVNQFISLPVEDTSYPITAMGFIQQLDSSTGIGPMFVATANKFYFFNTQQPRVQWETGQFGGLLISNAGLPGNRAFVNVNSDLAFITPNMEIHTLSTARNEARKWGNIPISREVQNYLQLSSPELAQFAVAGYFNNRLYFTANPYRVISQGRNAEPIFDYVHGGFVVLEIENLASLVSAGTPCWAGLWTGVNPMEFVSFEDEAFIVSKDGCQPFGENAIYTLEENELYDTIGRYTRSVRSIIETRQYDFGNGYIQKQEGTVALHFGDLEGKISLDISRKPQQSSDYLKWGDWSYEAPVETCDFPTDEQFNGFAEHNFEQLIFGDAKVQACHPLLGEQFKIFQETQLKLIIEGGEWTLMDVKISANEIPFVERQEEWMCKKLPPKLLPAQCDETWNIPEPTICP